MGTDDIAHRQPLAAFNATEIHQLEIGGIGQVGAQLAAAAQHQSPAANVALACDGIGRIVDGCRDIDSPIILVLQMERESGEVDIIAGHHHLVHRRCARRDFDHRLRVVQPPQVFVRRLPLVNAERCSEATAAAAGGGYDLEMVGTSVFKQNGFGSLSNGRAKIGERNRLLVDFGLTNLY